ncbi:GAF domain-containing protein [Sphingomonas mollis]|nr:GAF domain-containing protein [Sphingomonas sp. BT553]
MRIALHAQWAGVNVISADWQHVIAASGGMLGDYRRSTSISSYVVSLPDTPFVVLDASTDERLAGSPFVYDGLIRFYAGAVFRDRDGYALGALCVTDAEPRHAFSNEDAALLMAFAGEVID